MGEQATIFALSSGHGRAGVAVIRVSGPAAGAILDLMAPPRPRKRMAALRRIKHPMTGEVLDRGLVLWFGGPRSETGEDMAELQVHGGAAVIRGVLDALAAVPGCRLAEPGEFARRAFENGKLGLTEVEGLADLIEAETAAQRRQALRQAAGALSDLYEGWRSALINAAALVEAAIDFSDEGDVPAEAARLARRIVEDLETAVRRHLDDGHRGEILRDGFHVVLAGPPNVGKSSLLNALARRDAAIVSEEAGTTRDVIEVRLDLGGLPVIVSDTAGLREAIGTVEREGIRRTLARADEADLVVWLIDATGEQTPPPDALASKSDGPLVVVNKIDLLDGARAMDMPSGSLAVSAKTGQGIEALTSRLSQVAAERIGDGEDLVITHARYRQQLEICAECLTTFLRGSVDEFELRAEDLRRAAQVLGRITGRVDVEDVLDRLFQRFCIGK